MGDPLQDTVHRWGPERTRGCLEMEMSHSKRRRLLAYGVLTVTLTVVGIHLKLWATTTTTSPHNVEQRLGSSAQTHAAATKSPGPILRRTKQKPFSHIFSLPLHEQGRRPWRQQQSRTRRRDIFVSAMDNEEEEQPSLHEELDAADFIPKVKDDRGIGNPVFVQRRQRIWKRDWNNPLDWVHGLQPVERYKDWDFENGDELGGYEINIDTESPHVTYIPEGYTHNDDDEYWDFENDMPLSPEALADAKKNDPNPPKSYDEEYREWIADMVKDPAFQRTLETRGALSPAEDICKLLSACLAELDPVDLHIIDKTGEFCPFKQSYIWFSVTSEAFENVPTMRRQLMAEEILQPVYSAGVRFIEAQYRAPSEYARNIVPVITRFNVSNTVGVEINSTGLAWKHYESPALDPPLEDYDIDEDDDPERFQIDLETLRALPWYRNDFTPDPMDGKLLQPHTQDVLVRRGCFSWQNSPSLPLPLPSIGAR